MQNSFELFCFLKNQGYLKNSPHKLWWPNAGSFEVVIGAILVQNTRWEKAFEVINRLKMQGLLNLHSLADISAENLQAFMKDLDFLGRNHNELLYCVTIF